MDLSCVRHSQTLLQHGSQCLLHRLLATKASTLSASLLHQHRSTCTRQYSHRILKQSKMSSNISRNTPALIETTPKKAKGMCASPPVNDTYPIELQLFQGVWDRHQLNRKILGAPAFPSNTNCDSYSTFTTFSDGSTQIQTHFLRHPPELIVDWEELGIPDDQLPENVAWREIYLKGAEGIAEPTLALDQLTPEERAAFEDKLAGKHIHIHDPENPSKRFLRKQVRIAEKKDRRKTAVAQTQAHKEQSGGVEILERDCDGRVPTNLMTSDSSKPVSSSTTDTAPATHRPLVVGLTKPSSQTNNMSTSDAAAALNKEIEKNVSVNTKSAAPADAPPAESSQPKQKKEKAPKQPKPPKAAPAAAPTSPALIDLRVGHILRAIAHPNADSLYVSTIAMGDAEGTEYTEVDEETGKVVRTVCSGLNGLVPLAEMQDRKIIVVANLKPVNMRSIKSAAMVLAASPKQAEGADPHAPDRVVELVSPPEGSEAGDKVYFEGWPYGDGKGPEKQLNPKKKQWEAIQPGFYTSEDLTVGFDAGQCEEVSGSDKGNLVVEGKGVCTVKTLKGAVVK